MVELRIYCQPRASKTEIVGIHGDALKVRVMAPPVAGEANEELCQYLARCFTVSRKKVRVLSGEGTRQKCILIEGKTIQAIEDRLSQILP
jgi:hypothetical protein